MCEFHLAKIINYKQMNNIIGILREGLSKKGEKRVAVTPEWAKHIIEWGHKLIVQPAAHPEIEEIKRAFSDEEFSAMLALARKGINEIVVSQNEVLSR
jgi:NAD/NADP transhydrogenase alpha subunit